MKKFYFFAFLMINIIGSTPNAFSQIASRQGKNNVPTPKFKNIGLIKEFSVSEKTIQALLKQDSIETSQGLPYRFGKDIVVDIDFLKESKRIQSEDSIFYVMDIKSPKAFSINLIFEKIVLSNTASLTIYSKDYSFVYGPIKKKDITENGEFWTDLIKGDHIIIELADSDTKGINNLHINRIIHGYKNTLTPNLYGDSFSCHVDIACPQGSGWRKEADAVAMILLDSATRWCSGALINNTARDFKGYLLTAFHCLDFNNNGVIETSEKGNVNNWLFRFKYESPTCGGVDGTSYVTYNGSNFRAAYAPTDMALLELFTSPNLADCVKYAGWYRTAYLPSTGTGIHHPKGDVKKISFDRDAVSSNSTPINWTSGLTSPPNSHWVVDFDEGTTEGGSSGSPLFNQNHQIVGQLHGGASGCAPITKYYGKFHLSWTGGWTNDTRLSNWLDPMNTGEVSIDTESPVYISGPSQLCEQETYEIPNLPTSATVTWTATGSITISDDTGNYYVDVIKNSNGAGMLTANINTTCGSIVLSKPITAGLPAWSSFTYLHVQPSAEAGDAFEGYIPLRYLGASSYTWNMSTTNGVFSGYEWEDGFYVSGHINVPGNYDLWVTAHTDCGDVELWTSIIIRPKYDYFFSVYPNPTSSEVIIAYDTDKNSNTERKSSVKTFKVQLFNEKGEKIAEKENQQADNKVVFDMRGLKNGMYFVHIYDGKDIIKRQILIKE